MIKIVYDILRKMGIDQPKIVLRGLIRMPEKEACLEMKNRGDQTGN